MKFNRQKFWKHYREAFHGDGEVLPQSRVNAVNLLLDSFETDVRWSSVRHIAYAFATMMRETFVPKTNSMFEPISEFGGEKYFNKRYGPQTKVGKRLGNIHEGDGALFRGRGYVQITGRDNYQKFGIVNNPEKALEHETAFAIMTRGMFEGSFTGRAFAHYITATKTDYYNARRIINGTDHAEEIANNAKEFEAILRISTKTETVGDSATQPPSTTPKPDEELLKDSVIDNSNIAGSQPSQPPVNKETAETIKQYIPKISQAKNWLGGFSIVGLFSTILAKVAEMPQWFIFLIGIFAGIGLIGLIWLFLNYYKQVFALVREVIKINADPEQNNVQLTADKN